ncbi:hypothetical protein O7627_32615 [Solwaraspora sp. WMMD1047]|uniref:hypothetical protein n=1 Tax=Solwaraspora sp. WMMD1047 TaxID=3016102 RepID=UPI002417AF7A|nr:hypothetical protein [Solwaraspora sp. WMMD1047]MDG4834013.1 hypothetical protein [Solwaraspora sp. WMMD1047]
MTDDGVPTRANRVEAARRVKQAHDAGVRCCWSCGPGCDELDRAAQVLAEAARRPPAGRAVSRALRSIG